MFGCNNYGEIPGLYNSADGDPWDVFAPGYAYKCLPRHTPVRITEVIGFLQLDNGNDKLAICVDVPGWCKESAAAEIVRYCRTYTRRVKSASRNWRWVAFSPQFEWRAIRAAAQHGAE